jgi:hypothetical protein
VFILSFVESLCSCKRKTRRGLRAVQELCQQVVEDAKRAKLKTRNDCLSATIGEASAAQAEQESEIYPPDNPELPRLSDSQIGDLS